MIKFVRLLRNGEKCVITGCNPSNVANLSHKYFIFCNVGNVFYRNVESNFNINNKHIYEGMWDSKRDIKMKTQKRHNLKLLCNSGISHTFILN